LELVARWPGRMRGAIMPSLIFLVTFCIKAKSDKQELQCRNHFSNTYGDTDH
jgi:hypothetical protein